MRAVSDAGSEVLLQRLTQSLEIASSLHTADAATVLTEVHGYATTASMPASLRGRIHDVLRLTEAALRSSRPHWAAAIRDELDQLPAA